MKFNFGGIIKFLEKTVANNFLFKNMKTLRECVFVNI